jgi:hypothetical protein
MVLRQMLFSPAMRRLNPQTTFLVLGLPGKRLGPAPAVPLSQHRIRIVAEWQRFAESRAAKDVNGV